MVNLAPDPLAAHFRASRASCGVSGGVSWVAVGGVVGE